MDPDLLKAALEPVRVAADAWARGTLPPAAVAVAGEAMDLAGLSALALVLAALGSRLHRGVLPGPPACGLVAGGVLMATALFAWLLLHPSAQFDGLFRRWDHLAFCAVGGLILERMPRPMRTWLVVGISVGILTSYVGPLAVAVVVGTGLLGWAVARTGIASRGVPAAAVQGLLLAAVYAYCLVLRTRSLGLAWPVQGLLMWFGLRHVSAVIEVARGARIGMGDYLAYVAFYPGSMGPFGAPEVYAEFSRRNLARSGPLECRLAARRVVVGSLQAWLGTLIPNSAAATLASTTMAEAWVRSVVLFVQTALLAMGWWSMIEGGALFLGIRLRPNFAGLLTCENPSDLWRSWRGTMTNWLVQHVYAPLGANRRHQARNIVAAFAASLVWHWLGVPFASAHFHAAQLAPITLWAAVNAAAVVVHLRLQQRRFALLPTGTPAPVARGSRRLLTFALGSLAVTLPQFQGATIDRFPAFVRLLLGLG